jgi:hypothetical protein
MVALFILSPLGALLSGSGQVLAANAFGLEVYNLYFSLYDMNILREPGSDIVEWYIALIDNAIRFSFGTISLAVGMLWSNRSRPLRLILAEIGLVELAWTLVVFPLWDLSSNNYHGWTVIYSFRHPVLSAVVLCVHLLSLLGFFLFIGRNRAAQAFLFNDPNVKSITNAEESPPKLKA